ncbi:MAG: S1 family peptidase [Roseibium sp.]|uniref:trypsin-like serine protease n=1 Tax=Roseibium sp. TaxID=1936156 RepID=UPI00345BCE63|nr:S1 family peptidase [Roseibium sp.]
MTSLSYADRALSIYNPSIEPGAVIKVLGGRPADPNDWPATYAVRNGSQRCTANLIGSRVILTAGHCVDDDQKGQLYVGPNAHNFDALDITCDRLISRMFPSSADFALCLTETSILSSYPSIRFEEIFRYLTLVRKFRKVTALGFGCTEIGGTPDGLLTSGIARIVSVPTTNLYIQTRGPNGLCSGDSGGSAFMYSNRDKTKRVIVGVSSLGNSPSRLSAFSAVGTKVFVRWARRWADQNDVYICGLHRKARNCRNN